MALTSFPLLKHHLSRLRAWLHGPRMVYGVRGPGGQFYPHSRVGSSTVIEHPQTLQWADHVFIGHHNFLDASGGLQIGEGCQITSHVAILTHSSHIALRLHGRSYFGHPQPVAMRRAQTVLEPYVFVGPHSVITPGSKVGRGALIRAHSYVSGEVPAFAVMACQRAGQAAVQVGDTREMDQPWLADHPELQVHYDAWTSSHAHDTANDR